MEKALAGAVMHGDIAEVHPKHLSRTGNYGIVNAFRSLEISKREDSAEVMSRSPAEGCDRVWKAGAAILPGT